MAKNRGEVTVEGGGRADKLGNRYEGRWVARSLLLALAGELVSVTVESVGDDERGVDLWLARVDGTREAQQCKRKNWHKGRWTVSDLRARGVLGHLAHQLRRDPRHHFTLVSGDRAPDL